MNNERYRYDPKTKLTTKVEPDYKALLQDALKALYVYGNEGNWSKPYERQGVIGYQVKKTLHIDGGKLARDAIEAIGEI